MLFSSKRVSRVFFSAVFVFSFGLGHAFSVLAADSAITDEKINNYNQKCGFEVVSIDDSEEYLLASENSGATAGEFISSVFPGLGVGQKEAIFSLQGSSLPDSEKIAKIDITIDGDDEAILETIELTKAIFKEEDSWQSIKVPFYVPDTYKDVSVKIVLSWAGKGDLSCRSLAIVSLLDSRSGFAGVLGRLRSLPMPSKNFLTCVIAGATLGAAWTFQTLAGCNQEFSICLKDYAGKTLVGGALGAGVYGVRWFLAREGESSFNSRLGVDKGQGGGQKKED